MTAIMAAAAIQLSQRVTTVTLFSIRDIRDISSAFIYLRPIRLCISQMCSSLQIGGTLFTLVS